MKNSTSTDERDIPKAPISGAMELTARCNLKCIHCYINLPSNDVSAIQAELSYEEICRIINQITIEGCLKLTITGGEPLLRKDFLDIYLYIKKCGIIPTLFTNGTLITPPLVETLRKWPPQAIEITLHGATRKTYEGVTGIPGSYNSCMRGIDLLIEGGLPIKLKTTVMKRNKHEILQIKKLADELDIEFRFDTLIIPRIDGSKKPCSQRLSPAEVVQFDSFDKRRLRDWEDYDPKKTISFQQKSEIIYPCKENINQSFWIDPFGKLSLCHTSRIPNYDLCINSFQECRRNLVSKLYSMKPTKTTKCMVCDLRSYCELCPGLSYLEYGDPETLIEYNCQLTHLRAEKFAHARPDY